METPSKNSNVTARAGRNALANALSLLVGTIVTGTGIAMFIVAVKFGGLITWFLGLGALSLSVAGAYVLVGLIPIQSIREPLRMILGVPFALSHVGLFACAVALQIGLAVMLHLAIFSIAILGFLRTIGAADPSLPAVAYVVVLFTLLSVAYGRTGILWPFKCLIRLSPSENTNEKALLNASTAVLRYVNLRHVVYVLVILVYVSSVVVRLSGLQLSSQWKVIADIALEVLLAFIAVDTYLATFKPGIIAPVKPLHFHRVEAGSSARPDGA